MRGNIFCISIVAASLIGCASKPVEVADSTPLHPTAVIEKRVINNGLKGFFPTESSEQNWVRSDMRRDETHFKGTGTYSGYLLGSSSNTNIRRIDRNLWWVVNTEKSEYSECPLHGCPTPQRPPAKRAESPPEAQHEAGCTMSIAKSNFTVKSTGQKKTINGFDSEEYQVVWIINLRDKTARNTTSTLSMEIWTTPLTAAMRDTLAIEESYARAFSGTLADTNKSPAIPAEAAKLISTYLASSLNASTRNAFFDAGKQMEKIKGYPIYTHLAWDMEGNACAAKEAKAKEESGSKMAIPTSVGGLVAGLGGMFAKQKTDEAVQASEHEPILSFSVEVKSLKTETLHDSIFSVPSAYKLLAHP